MGTHTPSPNIVSGGQSTDGRGHSAYLMGRNTPSPGIVNGGMMQQTHTVPAEGPMLASRGNILGESPNQVRVLTLNDGEHQESTLYRLQKGWRLQMRLGPSLFGRHVTVYCNHPLGVAGEVGEETVEVDRQQFRRLAWLRDAEGRPGQVDDSAHYVEVALCRAGPFRYYFVYEGGDGPGPQGSGYFVVDPVLTVGEGEVLPLDCIQCHTVLSKCLGAFSTWERKLQVSWESGYNMIHFTPVQELGGSNSSYSLSDQHKLNPIFSEENREVTFEDLQELTTKMRREWKVASICDVVLNHTANESCWLREHPECTFNLVNCPHLRPAYLLDAMLHLFSLEVAEGKWEFSGIPAKLDSEDHLAALQNALLGYFLPQVKIPELFLVDVEAVVAAFERLARARVPAATPITPIPAGEQLRVIPDPHYRRFKATVDMELALRIYNVYRSDCFDEESRLRRCAEDLKVAVESLNRQVSSTIHDHLRAAVHNTVATVRYFRVQVDGPRLPQVTAKSPLVPRYFTDHGHPSEMSHFEDTMYSPDGRHVMAHNGWVINDDPLRNFAGPGSHVYLRRELVAWGDSVKLRYGERPEDCPFLWQHMQAYVERTASLFDGLRLDNCHSTPIPVAEHMLDAARRVRPDLYVVAELFTDDDAKDNVFVNRLGVSSLIRESMSAWDSHELGRLVYRYGGDPVGAFSHSWLQPLTPAVAHALFLDVSHDNPSPIDSRSVFHTLPTAGLVAMATCATGSTRGLDEFVPHHVHVVDEDRQYAEWVDSSSPVRSVAGRVSHRTGMIAAKRALNCLHYQLAIEGYSQVFVDQVDKDIVAVTRHRPDTHESVILVSHTAFSHPPLHWQGGNVRALQVEGIVQEVILEGRVQHVKARSGGSPFARPDDAFVRTKDFINGLDDYEVELREHVPVGDCGLVQVAQVDSVCRVMLGLLPPGAVVVLRVSLHERLAPILSHLQSLVQAFTQEGTDSTPCPAQVSRLRSVVSSLSLASLNRVLYRCEEEERDEGQGVGAYHVPGWGPLVYCGLQGFMSVLADVRPVNDLGHPFCSNLREGDWMMDYISSRLVASEDTRELGTWLEENLRPVSSLPRYLVPTYFDLVVTGTYGLVVQRAWDLMSDFVRTGSTFVRLLALGSVQCSGVVRSAPLPALSPALTPPRPDTHQVTLCAGLPHFSTGYMRNWGRDTFISLRGLYILTGRYQEARYHILAYAGCLRHGLIPNLLDGGVKARYNCRDAVWWWLHCIRSYVAEVPAGDTILRDTVSRLYPSDSTTAVPAGQVDQPLHDVMQEALTTHFQGLTFRERNAGRAIDAHMADKGFNNQIAVHPETGFVLGGNSSNCGTWMDKMGSSEKAGNRGEPATPRDGSAVELVGLCKGVLGWLGGLAEAGAFPYGGVQRRARDGTLIQWSYRQWEARIAANFERCFYIGETPTAGEPHPELIHRRGIYKDTYRASQPWADYQLRCNFPIAMVVAPDMFDPVHAWTALQKAESLLLGPLGMKTLDPSDWAYHGNYNNADDSDNPKVAHGFNYHQGPEWLWPLGYFLRARLHFARLAGGETELQRVACHTRALLAPHFEALQRSPWRGLPELTNEGGSHCAGSCRVQAWSMASILEVLHDLSRLDGREPIVLEERDN